MPKIAKLITSQGDITVKLLDEVAPKTVENFVGLSTGSKQWRDPNTGQTRDDPLYDGTVFHRVIDGFMIQGGDPTGTGRGDPGYRFEDEVEGNPSLDKPGYLAMANAGPHTNGSQFFITVAPTTWLDGKHTVFGEVIEGQDVVESISKLPTGPMDRPVDDVVLHKVEISEQ